MSAPRWTFEAPASASRPRRRLLLLTYHYPPSPAAGAVRWEQFTRYAAERGWGVDTFSLAWDQLTQRDAERLRELPPDTRILGVPDPEPPWLRLENRVARATSKARRRGRREGADEPAHRPIPTRPTSLSAGEMAFHPTSLRSWYRGYSSLTTALRERAWARRAAHLAAQRFDPSTHALVVSSGPPHAAHDGARVLAELTRLPLVLDLRDPWSLVERAPEHVASPVGVLLARRWEQRAVARAGLVVMNTEAARRAMAETYPARAGDVICVMNGYDEAPPPDPRTGRRFVVAYAGAIYLDRSPRMLFQAAARVVRELSLEPEEFGIELMGWIDPLDGVSIPEMAAEAGIGPYVAVHAAGTRAQAGRFLAGAHLLVSLPQDSHMAIPSKLFEYMRHPAWILSLARRGSATELLLRDTPADVVEPDDVDGLAAVLRRRVLAHRDGSRPAPLSDRGDLSRRAQARILFDAIDARLPGA